MSVNHENTPLAAALSEVDKARELHRGDLKHAPDWSPGDFQAGWEQRALAQARDQALGSFPLPAELRALRKLADVVRAELDPHVKGAQCDRETLDRIAEILRDGFPEADPEDLDEESVIHAIVDLVGMSGRRTMPGDMASLFTLDEARVGRDDFAERYPVEDDHSAAMAIDTAIQDSLITTPAGYWIGVDLLANLDGELDGYRILVRADPHAGRHAASDVLSIQQGGDEPGTLDVLREAVAAANGLLATVTAAEGK